MEGMHVIGLDMGYSGAKGFYENGNFCFPNFCRKITGELFGELNRNEFVYEDLDTGEKYYVGDIATKSLKADSVVTEDNLYGRNHYLHAEFLVIARTALAFALWEIPETDGSNIFLQTGLPPKYLSTDEPYLRNALQREHHFAVSSGSERKEFHFELKAENIDVMYQPMGTYYSVVFDNDGKMTPIVREYMNSNLLVFDGGFGTLDKFMICEKQVDTKDTNADLGMRRVLDETRKLIKSDLGVDISIPAMQACLQTGKVKKMDMINMKVDEYPIEGYLEKANALVREEAFEDIKSYVFDIRYLIMTGGTGAAWYSYFKERLSGMSSLSVIQGNQGSGLPSIYSNARGYYMYRLGCLRSSRTGK